VFQVGQKVASRGATDAQSDGHEFAAGEINRFPLPYRQVHGASDNVRKDISAVKPHSIASQFFEGKMATRSKSITCSAQEQKK
jgi:hypothetical protein